MISWKARASVACIGLCWTWAASAQGARETELTLAAALETALLRNPDLIASAFALAGAQTRLIGADVRPNPELTLELENFAGSGALRGADSLETTLAMSQVIELGGKRGLRRAVAIADIDLNEIEQRGRQLDLLAEVTRRFVDAAAAQERLILAGESEKIARASLDAISRRVDAARSPIAERSRARIALTRAQIELHQADSELRAARYGLAASFGDAEPQFETVRADLYGMHDAEPIAAYLARIERNPELTRFGNESRLRDAELRLAQAQSRPNLSLSLGVRQMKESGDTALIAGVSMPIAWTDRNRGAIAEARVRVSQNEAQRTASFNHARATLVALYHELKATRIRTEALRTDAVPLAEEALKQTRIAYERGRLSFLELATSQQEVLELKLAAIDSAADHHRLRAELERLTGEATP